MTLNWVFIVYYHNIFYKKKIIKKKIFYQNHHQKKFAPPKGGYLEIQKVNYGGDAWTPQNCNAYKKSITKTSRE